ncbi:MAG: SH3 domain-containing protein [Pseudotabrizicola sp.]|uniref:SH3 domain-containing protein n=1 Tax=Pseudotabrizicola sp. TaxID=2939647 RepID=UPI002718B323|nr:SH3 domain-containing protein [Pseudotabrizicola sp.]MDO9639540.1 SH3 domain-containing protein [Pseudotabrizicola sp.]
MIRMLLLLCAGLFLTLQIGGQDRGQKRLGLVEAANAPVRVALPVVEDSAPLGAAAEAAVMPVSFGTAQPVMMQSAPADVAQVSENAADTGATVTGATVRYVSAQAVNVRVGPSTRDAVMDTLRRGEAVTVVGVESNGWARVRVEGDGIDGFMSMSFLSDTAP